jgi:hypothetical protein
VKFLLLEYESDSGLNLMANSDACKSGAQNIWSGRRKSIDHVLAAFGQALRFCRWSVAPLRFGFPDGTGDVIATVLQKNSFS